MHHCHHLNANDGLERHNLNFKITYIDYRLACGFKIAVYCMAATIYIMITITEYTMLRINYKRNQNIMEQKGKEKKNVSV